MLRRSWGRALAAVVLLSAPLLAGDYDHVFDVVREAWPDRTVAMALCDKDANQMTLIELADSAKAHNLNLVIVDLKSEKDYNKTIIAALTHNPGFFLLLEDDAITGLKGPLTSRMIYRVAGKSVPTVALSKAALKLGAVLTAGPGTSDPVYVSNDVAKRMDLALPAGAIDPAEHKTK